MLHPTENGSSQAENSRRPQASTTSKNSSRRSKTKISKMKNSESRSSISIRSSKEKFRSASARSTISSTAKETPTLPSLSIHRLPNGVSRHGPTKNAQISNRSSSTKSISITISDTSSSPEAIQIGRASCRERVKITEEGK